MDLAGSERSSKTGVKAGSTAAKESISINKSLSALGDVINALWSIHVAKEKQEEQQQQRADGASGGGGEDGDGDQAKKKKQLHVPYRDSVLTKLLADSLGGNSRTVMLANISLAESNIGESTSTLRFASRVKTIKNKPKVVVDPKDAKLKEMSAEIDRLRQALVEQAKEGAVSSSSSRDHSDHPSGGSMIVSQELFDDANERIRAMQAAHERQITDLTAKMEAEVKARDKEVERLAAEIARMKKSTTKDLHPERSQYPNSLPPPHSPNSPPLHRSVSEGATARAAERGALPRKERAASPRTHPPSSSLCRRGAPTILPPRKDQGCPSEIRLRSGVIHAETRNCFTAWRKARPQRPQEVVAVVVVVMVAMAVVVVAVIRR